MIVLNARDRNSRILRFTLVLGTILSACSIHLISEHPLQTPISEELARRNPIAICFMLLLMGLVIHLIYEMHRVGSRVQAWSLSPVLPCLVAIALTGPTTGLHLQIFAGMTLYGFVWLALFSYLQGHTGITFVLGLLFVFSMVCLLVLTVVGVLSPSMALSLSPLGVLQRVFVVLFSMYAMAHHI